MSKNIVNFGGGPAKLPREVLIDVQEELLDFNNTGMSIMEISHRSPVYGETHNNVIRLIKELLNVPDNYKILLMHGGGQGMFAAIPANLIMKTGCADYIVTGLWSRKAAEEASKFGKVHYVLPETEGNFAGDLPESTLWKFNPDASYVYYCGNETIEGFEFPFVPDSGKVPLVCDMSSNILTKKVDVSKYGIIFAGAQKNLGPSGVTIAIVREDLLGFSIPQCPTIFEFSTLAKANSLLNTPATFNVYVVGKVLDYVKRKGGVKVMESACAAKAKLLYEAIDASNGFYFNKISPRCRSRINATFHINAGAESAANFVERANQQGMVQLKGHRLVGGLRASLYNAVTLDEVQTLVNFMKKFETDYKNKNR